MTYNFQEIEKTVTEELNGIQDAKQLEDFRIKYLGRKGLLTEIYAGLTTLPKEERPIVGKNANELKNKIEQLIDQKKKKVDEHKHKSASEILDVTLPGVSPSLGHRHILTQTINQICTLFQEMGFVIYEGPEIETEFNNFSALNIPIDHPSRDAFDTFYLESVDPTNKQRNLLLRSHTSPSQVRIMEEFTPPLAVVVP